MLLVLGVAEPPAALGREKRRSEDFKEVLSATLVRDTTTRLVFLGLVASGAAGLVMVWTHQKYWQDSGVSLAYFGVLHAGYNLIFGFAGRSAALASARYGRQPVLAAVGVLPIVACLGMPAFFGWAGIVLGLLGQIRPGPGQRALSERVERDNQLRIPRDRDLAGAAGDPCRLRSSGSPRGLRDRRLGIAVCLVGPRNPVLDRFPGLAHAADSAGKGPEPGRRATE
jgi:hypothetical protein